MKRSMLIPVLLLAFVVLSSKQCAEEVNPQAELEAQLEEIQKVQKGFELDYLRSESLYAYEERAKQKLFDFADYLNITKDKALDISFRTQAMDMLAGLFYQQKLPSIIRGPFNHINVHSIHVTEPLARTSEATYAGQLTFFMEMTVKAGTDTGVNDAEQWSVEMIAMKTPAILGKDTIFAWKVYLGHMKKP